MKGILLDDNGDLLVKKGGLTIGENSDQIIEQVLIANRGEYKEHPLLGAEIIKLQNGTTDPVWATDAKVMLKYAGVKVNKVKISGNQIIVE